MRAIVLPLALCATFWAGPMQGPAHAHSDLTDYVPCVAMSSNGSPVVHIYLTNKCDEVVVGTICSQDKHTGNWIPSVQKQLAPGQSMDFSYFPSEGEPKRNFKGFTCIHGGSCNTGQHDPHCH